MGISFLAFFLAGCSTRGGSNAFPSEIKIPASGGQLPEEFWQKAGEAKEDERPLYYSWSWSWALPLTFSMKSAQMPRPDMLVVSRRVHNDIGFPLLLLPLRHKYAAYVYEPDSAQPVEGEWASWTPLWVSSGTVPGGASQDIKAGGIGLFYSRISMKAPQENTLLWQALWSLGPVYYSQDKKMPHPNKQTEPPYQNATLFMPLALGGLPGALVWLDATVRSSRPDQAAHVEAHGPLLGTLGYLEYDTLHENVRSKMRFVGTGLLWTDLRSNDPAKPGEFAAHGPLWTMFGWGKKNGKSGVRLFWIPIRL